MTNEFKRSTANLKKAVPLMIKNQVPATPANYALWYTYVDKTMPKLNTEMDNVLASYTTCPPATNQKLYDEYVARKSETNLQDLRSSVEVLLTEVASSMSDTISDTSSFSDMIDKSFSQLEQVDHNGLNMEEVMNVVRQLASESKEIRHSTRFLNNQLSTASDEISRLKTQLAEIQKDVLFDGLSGLYNRRAFDHDLATLATSDQKMSLIMIDIDHFKKFNDDYGHLFGDAVIKSLAKKLQQSCREGINAYRYGGEEFALIVPNKSLAITRRYAENLRGIIEKIRVKDRRNGKQVYDITASFGVSEYKTGEAIEDLIERADSALYEAKQLGRNRVMPI